MSEGEREVRLGEREVSEGEREVRLGERGREGSGRKELES